MPPRDPRDEGPTGHSPDETQTQAAVATLLAAQPDPGLMPASVVQRVEAALATAADRRAADDELFDELGFGDPAALVEEPAPETIRFGVDVDGGARGASATRGTDIQDAPEGGDVVPLVRRRWPILAAAAAAVVVLGAGAVVGLVQVRKGTEGLASLPGASAPPFNGSRHVQVSNTAYTKATLATGAQTLLTAPGAEASVGDAPSVGPLVTGAGLDSCIAGLGQGDATGVSVDLATYEGAPAAVVVVRKGDATQVYAVERDCANGDPGVIQDAVPVP